MTSSIEDQFLSVAMALGAEEGTDDYHRGMVRNTPMLMKLIDAEPLSYMFKLRMTGARNEVSEWPSSLPQRYAEAGIRCEIEDDYIFLWIHAPQHLDAELIAALVHACIQQYADYFPPSPGYCYDCRASGVAEVVQSGESISALCPACLEKRKAAKQVELDRIGPPSPLYLLFTLVAVGGMALVWALIWTFIDVFVVPELEEQIWVPRWVLGAFAAPGCLLGWPLGKLLSKSRIVTRFPRAGVSCVVTLILFVLGEICFAALTVYRFTGIIDIHAALSIAPTLAFSGGNRYVSMKIAVLIMLGITLYRSSRSRWAELNV